MVHKHPKGLHCGSLQLPAAAVSLTTGSIAKTVKTLTEHNTKTWGNGVQVEKYQSYPTKFTQMWFKLLLVDGVWSHMTHNEAAIVFSE